MNLSIDMQGCEVDMNLTALTQIFKQTNMYTKSKLMKRIFKCIKKDLFNDFVNV